MDDTQIIDLYFQRKESAIQETAEKYGAYLNQISYNILRSREDTEEIVEDTYFAAWNAIPPTKPLVLKHFLSRITRNLSFTRLDYLTAKRRNGHMAVLLSELEECIPDERQNPEKRFHTRETAKIINGFLETLSREECRIFLCRYYYNLTIPEIAEKYGLKPRTVKYRLSLMRQSLKKRLEKEGITV